MKKIRKYYDENQTSEMYEFIEEVCGLKSEDLHDDSKCECVLLDYIANIAGDIVNGTHYAEVRQLNKHLYVAENGKFNCSCCWYYLISSNKKDAINFAKDMR